LSGYDVVIIGADANGLAAAAKLSIAGRRVLVLERSDGVGGLSRTLEFYPGFKANVYRDGGEWIAPRLRAVLTQGGLQRVQRDVPVASIAVSDPDVAWPIYYDTRRTEAALETMLPRDSNRWRAFMEHTTHVTGFLERLYCAPPPRLRGSPGESWRLIEAAWWLRRSGRRAAMQVVRAIPMPIADIVGEQFEATAVQGPLCVFGIEHVLQGPLSAGTGLVFFHRHVGARSIGDRSQWRGGSSAVAEAFKRVAEQHGTVLRFHASVERIAVRDGHVCGVVANGEEIACPIVLSALDPKRTFSLVEPEWMDPKFLQSMLAYRYRGATARLHYALDSAPPFGSRVAWPEEWLGASIVVAESPLALERAYDAAKYGELPDRPALTITIPSVYDSSLAPPGKHVLSVSVHHVPYSLRGGWSARAKDALAALVERRLEELAPGLTSRVLGRLVLSPADIADRTEATEGSLTHGELALDQWLFARPQFECARYATPVQDLWLAGMSTHPVNGSGMSGWLAATEVLSA
jgi:phytoene dehydrogenase-like protein